MTTPVLALKQLACERDQQLLFSQLDLQLFAGDSLYVHGPNGCGKTTLLRTVAGLFTPTMGEIEWQTQAIRYCRHVFLKNLLFIGHMPGLHAALSPRENLRYLLGIHAAEKSLQNDQSIDDALEQVSLYGYENTPCYQLSAGQQRRVALARLYLSQHSLWILDEPYTALDKQGIARLDALFEQHNSKRRMLAVN